MSKKNTRLKLTEFVYSTPYPKKKNGCLPGSTKILNTPLFKAVNLVPQLLYLEAIVLYGSSLPMQERSFFVAIVHQICKYTSDTTTQKSNMTLILYMITQIRNSNATRYSMAIRRTKHMRTNCAFGIPSKPDSCRRGFFPFFFWPIPTWVYSWKNAKSSTVNGRVRILGRYTFDDFNP